MNLVTIHNVLPDGRKLKFATDGFVHGDVIYQYLKDKNIKGISQSEAGFVHCQKGLYLVNYTTEQVEVI